MKLVQVGEITVALSSMRTLELPRPAGALLGIQIVHEGQIDGGSLSAADDDAVFKLISMVELEIPTVVGNVVLRGPGRDLMLLARYQHSFWESSIPTSNGGSYNDGFVLMFGWPENVIEADHPWGIAHDAIMDSLILKVTFAAANEYNANATGVTSGRFIVSYILDSEIRNGRIALIPNSNAFPVESESSFTAKPINFAPGARGALGLLLRQEDTSAAADRVDGLVTHARVKHSGGITLWDENLYVGRNLGVQWARLDRGIVTAATPQGLDGTVLVPFNRRLTRSAYWPLGSNNAIQIEYDSAATVRRGQTNVTPASGDLLHCLALGVVAMG